MRKLFFAAIIIAAAFSLGLAQQGGPNEPNMGDPLKLGRAPSAPDGIGRAVVQIKDENGNPIPGASITLDSIWGGDHFCQSYGATDSNGVIALLPIHMGKLKLKVKAKGYRSQVIEIDPSSLNAPVIVKLIKK